MVGAFDNPYLGKMPPEFAAATYCAGYGGESSSVGVPKITGFSTFFSVLKNGNLVTGFVLTSETTDGTTQNVVEATQWALGQQAEKIATYTAGLPLLGLPKDTLGELI